MFNLLQFPSITLVVFLMLSLSTTANPPELAERQEAWRNELEQRKFGWHDNYCGLVTSLQQFTADCEVHIIQRPRNFRPSSRCFEFRFVRDNREVVSLPGHFNSAFTSYQNNLFFAKYSTDTTGCTILAYDLTTGKKHWETNLRGPKPIGHSGYANRVTIRMSIAGEVKGESAGAAIVVNGAESYTDYIEVLDRQSGASLAVKNYRIGFGQPPGSGGGFDMRGRHENAKGYGGPGGLESQ